MPEIGERRRFKYPCGTVVIQLWDACPNCGRGRWQSLRRLGRLCLKCANQQLGLQRRGISLKNHQNYIRILLDPGDFFYSMADRSGHIYEHRLVMAKYLGRCLLPWEVVHHKNSIRVDNRLENLKLLPSAKYHITNSRILQLKRRIKKLEAENKGLKEELGIV